MLAITRAVSPSLAHCELTHLARTPIDVARAGVQHAAYEAALRGLGVEVVRAQAEPEMPDAVFVEDTAVALEEGSIITRPGAESRRREVTSISSLLIRHGWLRFIEQGTLDGGDVLRLGKTIYVGRTGRTNEAGIEEFKRLVEVWGYDVRAVEIRGCLHLKSAVTQVGEGLVLMNPAWVSRAAFGEYEQIEVDPSESFAGNGLLVNGRVIYPEHFPRTRERLEKRGVRVVAVACDELAKAEGAVTCCSVLVPGSVRDS